MKIMSFIAVLFIGTMFSKSTFAQAQASVKENIKVWGSCEMCKKKIEKAAKSAGAETAVWDVDSHMLALEFTTDKTNNMKIQEAIAKVGYDTQDVTGDNKAYDKLHGCCKYDRKEVAATKKDN